MNDYTNVSYVSCVPNLTFMFMSQGQAWNRQGTGRPTDRLLNAFSRYFYVFSSFQE